MKSKLCWFSFYATEFGKKENLQSPSTQKQKKEKTATMGEVLGIPAGQFQKTGGLGRKKLILGKINA